MQTRPLGRTGMSVSAISFGAWAIGSSWGPVDDHESMAALHAAVDAGVNFIDTADVYGDGKSERLVAQLRKERRGEDIYVATKAGRRLPAQTPEGYTVENLTTWVDRSLQNLDVDALDLLQLHCPHPAVYDRADVFGILDDLVSAGKIRHYGVSVETVDEAEKAMRHPRVGTVQIIFNMFRLKPAEELFPVVREKQIGILARVPLASGLLSGKLRRDSTFEPRDHRNYNRHGESFDVGETFSGVDYETGLQAVEDLRRIVPAGTTMAQIALRWILMFPEVSAAIPGARNVQQTEDNVHAADLKPLTPEEMTTVRDVYDRSIRPLVHHRW
jgi:aryl-alcohol dehydrogenase-like predicted oxidoreductase